MEDYGNAPSLRDAIMELWLKGYTLTPEGVLLTPSGTVAFGQVPAATPWLRRRKQPPRIDARER